MANDPVADIKFIADRFKGILAIAETFSTKQSLDQQVEELTKSVSQSKIDLEKLNEEFAQTKKDCDFLISEAKKKEANVDKTVTELLNKAKDDGALIIKAANDKADEIKQGLMTEYEQIKNNIQAKTQELRTVASEVDAASVRLANVKQELARLREKI